MVTLRRLLKHAILSICIITLSLSGIAQEIVIPSEYSVRVGSISPMVVNNDVVGYYAFAFVEVLDNKAIWNMILMDINFKLTKEFDFSIEKTELITSARFNGSHIYFRLTDEKSYIRYSFYDLNGQLTGTYQVDDIRPMKLIKIGQDLTYPVPSIGMIRNGLNPKNEDFIEFINNSGERVWRIIPSIVLKNGKESGTRETQLVHFVDGETLILKINRPGLSIEDLNNQSNNFLSVIDIKTGKELYQVENRHRNGVLVPLGSLRDNDSFIEFGQFFQYDKQGVGYMGDKDLGMYTRVIDDSGIVLQENLYTWGEESASALDWRPNDYTGVNFNLWVHEIIKSHSGIYYVICESYSLTKLSDMVLLEFSPDLVPVKVYKFPKSSPGAMGIPIVNEFKLGAYFKATGMFDYQFTSSNADKSIFASVYTGTKYITLNKKEVPIEAIALNREAEISNPKIVLNSQAYDIRILPAKAGYVAVIELFYKEPAKLFLHKLDF